MMKKLCNVYHLSSLSEKLTPRSFGARSRHSTAKADIFFVAGNNNTHAGIVLGGGYLITDIQMSTTGRLVPNVPLAAGSGCDIASGAASRLSSLLIVGNGGGGARRSPRRRKGARGQWGPLVR